MMSLDYYLNKSAKGDNIAAYEAAKIMQDKNYSAIMVQAQLRKAAELGNVNAIRWLGFLGLSGKLISPESTVTKISYYKTQEQAFNWFLEGYKKGDVISSFVVGNCLKYGIGTQQDVAKSEEIISNISSNVPTDAAFSIIFLINTLHPYSSREHQITTP